MESRDSGNTRAKSNETTDPVVARDELPIGDNPRAMRMTLQMYFRQVVVAMILVRMDRH
jgi:hypothetical protein